MFKLHLIQAQFGDCLLIEFGTAVSKKFILIDGGPKDNYGQFLRGELESIIGSQGILEAVVITHVDIDHIKGILDLLAELKSQLDTNVHLFLEIKELWLNTFSSAIDTNNDLSNRMNTLFNYAANNNIQLASAGIAFNGIKEGDRVTTLCHVLGIPMNTPATQSILRVGSPNAPITFGNLTITIVGPTKENLDALKLEWEEWLAERENEMNAANNNLLAMSDKSVPNLSSIAFLVEGNGRKILFTGDGRGDHLIEGLKKKGMLTGGKMHVDVLKVAHHGSDRNSSRGFFENITADTYVISANGKDKNPDYPTLSWIIESANEAERPIKMIITNETPSTKKILQDYPTATWGYEIEYIPAGSNSIEV